jgi:hypothetical protein
MGPQRTAGNMRKNSVYPSHFFDMNRLTREYDLIPFGLRSVTLLRATPPG